MNLLDTSLKFLKMGLHPIPCHRPDDQTKCTCHHQHQCVSIGKHPAMPWHGLQKTGVSKNKLDAWFGEAGSFENYNLGLITGSISNNIFVLDVDLGEGKEGDESLLTLELEHDDLPQTLQTITGSGGRHYFFRAPKNKKIITGKNVLGPGLDVRGEGGFVVCEPSVHANGNAYKTKWDLIAEAPDWLINLVVEPQTNGHATSSIQEVRYGTNPFKAEDGREGVMYKTILAELHAFIDVNQSIPELEEFVDRAYPVYESKVNTRGVDLEEDNRGITLFRQRAQYQINRAKRGDLKILNDLTIDEVKKKTNEKLSITNWGLDKFQGTPEPVQWLVNGIIPMKIPMLLAAIGGLGKSYLALDLALKIAGGSDDWNSDEQLALGGQIKKFGKVVFFTAEDSAGAVHRRLDNMDSDLRQKAEGNLFVVPLPDAGGAHAWISNSQGQLHHTMQYLEIRDQLLAMDDLVLVIIDPLQAFVHADINSDPSAAQFWWSTLSELCATCGATVLVSHHMRKETAFEITRPEEARQAIRGTTALVDGSRLVYALWSLPAKEEKELCHLLELEHDHNRLAAGAVVKTNEFASMGIRKFVRNESGLLEDWTDKIDTVLEEREEITTMQRIDIFKEVKRRYSNGSAFSSSPQARTNSLVNYLVERFKMTRKIAKSKMTYWLETGELIATQKLNKNVLTVREGE